MTNIEKMAVLDACFGINFSDQSTISTSRSTEIHQQVDRMGDMCTICEWFGLNLFNDQEFVKRACNIDPKLQMQTILRMDMNTALLSYLYMYKACNLHGKPSAKKIELFNIFGRAHHITYEDFSTEIKSIIQKR